MYCTLVVRKNVKTGVYFGGFLGRSRRSVGIWGSSRNFPLKKRSWKYKFRFYETKSLVWIGRTNFKPKSQFPERSFRSYFIEHYKMSELTKSWFQRKSKCYECPFVPLFLFPQQKLSCWQHYCCWTFSLCLYVGQKWNTCFIFHCGVMVLVVNVISDRGKPIEEIALKNLILCKLQKSYSSPILPFRYGHKCHSFPERIK